MKALLRGLGFAGIAVGLLAYPVAYGVGAAAGRDLLIVEAAGDPAAVDANRGLWEIDDKPKDGVAKIYGTPSEVERLVFVPEEKVLHPKEDPSLSIYLKQPGDHPTQAQTLFFFAKFATIGGLVAGAALLFLGRRKQSPAPPG